MQNVLSGKILLKRTEPTGPAQDKLSRATADQNLLPIDRAPRIARDDDLTRAFETTHSKGDPRQDQTWKQKASIDDDLNHHAALESGDADPTATVFELTCVTRDPTTDQQMALELDKHEDVLCSTDENEHARRLFYSPPVSCTIALIETEQVPAKKPWILREIIKILETPQVPPSLPPFQFNLSQSSANHNFKILEENGMDLDKIIRADPSSPLFYGSEFKPVSILEPLFKHHPKWTEMKSRLLNGSEYKMEDLDEEERLGDLSAALIRGNHKSASGEKAIILAEKMEKEVNYGWSIPLLPHHAFKIPFAIVSPMGLVNQASINELGDIVYKDRVTHDLSFPGAISETSVNSRLDSDLFLDCEYGHMLKRCINYIAVCRYHQPTKRILIRKDDFKSAYRRQHLFSKAAAQSLTQMIKDGVMFLLLSLRLTFGGSPGPSEWSCIAEAIIDLANALLSCEEWNPDKIFSPAQANIPKPEILDDDLPLKPARSLIVDIPLESNGKVDLYIDDGISISIDTPMHRKRLEAALPLAIFIVARQNCPEEPLPRDDMLTLHKMIAEGSCAEKKIILGWLFNTRAFIVQLPRSKFIVWNSQIVQILEDGQVKKAELHELIGRLNHSACIMPLARHFLNRMRFLLSKMHNSYVFYTIKPTVRSDLELHLKILAKAARGISINLLTFREPTRGYWTDSCEIGLGGFNSNGKAWRWQIPEELRNRAHINLLEFLAELIGVWIDIIDDDLGDEECLLPMGDSSTAVGWIHRSRIPQPDQCSHAYEMKTKVARKFADLMIDNNHLLYSQWFPGRDNIIPDMLSRDWHLSDDEIFKLFTHLLPHQMHPKFYIKQVPKNIVSFVTSILSQLPKRPQQWTRPKTSGYGLGASGISSCHQSALDAMAIWKLFPDGKSTSFSPLSPKQSEKELSRRNELRTWLHQQSPIPSDMYHRPSGMLEEEIQD
eukprot:scaffold3660_cov246-Chaetoceros_neogracile.AAC.3